MAKDTNDINSTINEEECKSKLNILRAHLMQGVQEAYADQFVDDFSMDIFIDDLDNEASY